MSDLISRSEYKGKLVKALDVLNKEYREALLNEDNDLILAIQNQQSAYMIALRLLDNEPTAYDIDRVVKELEKEAERWEDSGKEYKDKCEIAVGRGLRNSIEIVKHGDVRTETETIRDKAVKWNNNSSKRVPYEFIDYVEGKREIGVAEDVCEWKQTSTARYKTSCGYKLEEYFDTNACYCKQCGKKIKIVGD